MEKQEFKLKEKAIAAYEASDLKQQDIARNKGAANCIREALGKFGIETDVTSDVFEIEGIRFYAYGFEDNEGIYAYAVGASCLCPDCKERIVKKVATFEVDHKLEPIKSIQDFSIENFGQWLSRPHLCEFQTDKEKSPLGYV